MFEAASGKNSNIKIKGVRLRRNFLTVFYIFLHSKSIDFNKIYVYLKE